MDNELVYQIALTMIPAIGAIHAKNLLAHFGEASAIFSANKKDLAFIEGIGEIRAKSIANFDAFHAAEKEIAFLEKHSYRPLFILSENYPFRLSQCNDAPIMLYYQGNANLNSRYIISIVGTRNNSDYGKQMTEKLISELPKDDLLIISGLALGIDGIAHKACLQNQIPTIGVLAHGLDTIYPYQHKSLARDLLMHGGLLTEFRKNTKPDKFNFPKRNRIVAGLSDVTIVMETALKGGSIITADLAVDYDRVLFALPGKITDSKSGGCNNLIKENKANIFTGTEDLLIHMGWQEQVVKINRQRQLFYEPSKDEAILLGLLKDHTPISIDELHLKSSLHYSTVAVALLNLEMNGILISLPGKCYRLLE